MKSGVKTKLEKSDFRTGRIIKRVQKELGQSDSENIRSTGALHPIQRVRRKLSKSSIPFIRSSVGILG
jgi:hypothetical protein